MNKAIITGASGMVGMSVAKHLSSMGVELLCLGRKNFNNTNKRTIRTIFKQMNQWANEELTKRIPKKQEAGFKRRTRRKAKLVSKP